MEKSSLYIIIMACFIAVGSMNYICNEHIKLENELYKMNIKLINDCSDIIDIYRNK